MRTTFKNVTCAALFACISVIGWSQASAADDADAQPGSKADARTAPSKTDSADTAFGKLDRSGKGYVTLEDVAVLPGFDALFVNADSSHLGRLNLTAFTQAWAAYVGGNN